MKNTKVANGDLWILRSTRNLSPSRVIRVPDDNVYINFKRHFNSGGKHTNANSGANFLFSALPFLVTLKTEFWCHALALPELIVVLSALGNALFIYYLFIYLLSSCPALFITVLVIISFCFRYSHILDQHLPDLLEWQVLSSFTLWRMAKQNLPLASNIYSCKTEIYTSLIKVKTLG